MKATKIPVIIRAIGLIKKGWRNISNKSRVTSTYMNYRSDYNNKSCLVFVACMQFSDIRFTSIQANDEMKCFQKNK